MLFSEIWLKNVWNSIWWKYTFRKSIKSMQSELIAKQIEYDKLSCKSNKLNVLVHYEYLIQVNQIFNIIHTSSMRSVCMHILVLPVLPSNHASKFLKIYLLNFHFSKVIDHRTWAFWENCLINHMMSKYMTLYIPPISLYLIGEFYILRCSLEISTLTLSIRTPWILSLQNSSALFLRDGMEASDSAGNWLVVKVIKFEFTS